MAIVPNKDGMGIKANGFYGEIDRAYDTPTLTGTAYPAVASQYAGQMYGDTVTGNVYRSLAAGSTTAWVETNIR